MKKITQNEPLISKDGRTKVIIIEKFHEVNGADICLSIVEELHHGGKITKSIRVTDSRFTQSGNGQTISSFFGCSPINDNERRVIQQEDLLPLLDKVKEVCNKYKVGIDVRCPELTKEAPIGLPIIFSVYSVKDWDVFNNILK